MAQQTAVEWLEMKVVNENDLQNLLVSIDTWFEQAKAMEKEQIINADLNGSTRTAVGSDFTLSERRVKELAEQYYNETYKK